MSTEIKTPVMLYTEQTPNPESLKFVTNRMLFKGTADFQDQASAIEWSPVAAFLFEFPYVKGVYISNNFITISKEFNYNWQEIMNLLKASIKEYIEASKPIVKDGYQAFADAIKEHEAQHEDYSEDDEEIVVKIKELLDTYVRPAVEMDGGNIAFKGFRKGVVSVELQGSCSGCPSSTVTLKTGIEGMLKRMIPEITEVVATNG